jgi:hypothetical protein
MSSSDNPDRPDRDQPDSQTVRPERFTWKPGDIEILQPADRDQPTSPPDKNTPDP